MSRVFLFLHILLGEGESYIFSNISNASHMFGNVHSLYFQVPINLFSCDLLFGFWYVGDDGHSRDFSHQHPEELHSRPGRSLPSIPRGNDILHQRILETLKNMPAERYILQKRNTKLALLFAN